MTPKEAGETLRNHGCKSTVDHEEALQYLRSTIDFLSGLYNCPDMVLALNIKRTQIEGLIECARLNAQKQE